MLYVNSLKSYNVNDTIPNVPRFHMSNLRDNHGHMRLHISHVLMPRRLISQANLFKKGRAALSELRVNCQP